MAAARASMFSSLYIRDFRLLWLGVSSHSAALWTENIARPYLVYELTGSPAQLGLIIVARTLPQFAFGIFAGVAIDWFDRKRVLQFSQIGAFVLNVSFAVLLVAGLLELWHIYAAAAIRGVTMAFDQPARQSLVPEVVPPDRVTNAIALFSATQNTMRIAGTAASGFLIAAIGVNGAFVAIAVIYAGTVTATSMLRVPPHVPPPASGAGAMLSGLGEAMRYAWRTPTIRGAIGLALIYFAFGLSFMQLFAPLFALEVLDIGAFGFGVMMSLTGAGSLVGALVIASRSPRRLGVLVPLMMVAFGTLLILFALSTYLPGELGRAWIALSLLLVFGAGLFQSGAFALVQVIMLDAAPDQMRGRLMGLLAFDRATMMMGAAAGGLLAQAIGTQPAQIIYALLVIVGAVAVLLLAPGFRATVVGEARRGAEERAAAAATREGASAR
ncbi:MAG: MFS transporter [Chloroflexi bacterium]|nr:MFS transporter [Chloroflexota bacterium]